MKSVPINYAETARRVGSGNGSAPDSDHLDLLGGALRDAYARIDAPMPDDLLALARRIETAAFGIGDPA